MRARGLLGVSLITLLACASVPERRAALIGAYRAAHELAQTDPAQAQQLCIATYFKEIEDEEMRDEQSVRAERSAAETAIQVTIARRRLAETRAAIEGGDFSQALEDHLMGADAPNELRADGDWQLAMSGDDTLWRTRQELLMHLRRKRGEEACPATLGPLLESKAISQARDALFGKRATLVCTSEWTIRVAEASLQSKLWGCAAAIDEAAELTDLLGETLEEEAFSHRAFTLATGVCIASGENSDLHDGRSRLARLLEHCGRQSKRGQLLLEADARLVSTGTQGVAALEAAGKFSEARSLAQTSGDTATVERIDREHPGAPGERLARGIAKHDGKAPIATALLQWVGRRYGKSTEVMAFKTEQEILAAYAPGGFHTQVTPDFELGSGCGCEEKLRGIFGQEFAAGPGNLVIKKAACSAPISPTSTTRTVEGFENRAATREIRSADGLTTRTAHVTERVAVTKTETVPDRDLSVFTITLQLTPRLPGFVEFQVTASGTMLRDGLRGQALQALAGQAKALQYIPPAEAERARARLSAATTELAREEAAAELLLVSQGQDQGAMDFFVRKYGISPTGPWPWAR